MALADHEARMILETATGTYKFLLPKELSGFYSYSTEYEELRVMSRGELQTFGEQSPLMWYQGKDDPVTVRLELVVGASEKIDTPEDLMRIVTELIRTAHPSSEVQSNGAQLPPGAVTLYIGTWFARNAIVKSAKIASLERPWDVATGLPYKAVVELELQYIYSKVPTNKDFSFEES